MSITTVLNLAYIWLAILSLCCVNGLFLGPDTPFAANPGRLVYMRDHLFELSRLDFEPSQVFLSTTQIPPELIRGSKRRQIRRKRGSRGGIRNRMRRRGSRLPLPAITLSNVRSLRNKADELSSLVRTDSDYRQTSLFCFTETWLSEDVDYDLDGFNIIRFDRDVRKTRKSIGGGLCIAVNKTSGQPTSL